MSRANNKSKPPASRKASARRSSPTSTASESRGASSFRVIETQAREFARMIDAANFLSASGCIDWHAYRALLCTFERWLASLDGAGREHALHVVVGFGVRP